MTSQITSKGQITIPIAIRKALKLKPGDKVQFVYDGGRAILIPAQGGVLALKGVLKPYLRDGKRISIQEIEETARQYAADRDEKSRKKGR